MSVDNQLQNSDRVYYASFGRIEVHVVYDGEQLDSWWTSANLLS